MLAPAARAGVLAGAASGATTLSWSGPVAIDRASNNQLGWVACPSQSQCTAIDQGEREVTFNPASPGTPAPALIDNAGYLNGLACPSVSQCTVVDTAAREVTFNPTDPGNPAPVAIDSNALLGPACPSVSQCTAVDSMAYELTFDPNNPGAPTPKPVYGRGDVVNVLACPTVSQCTAVDSGGYEVTFNPGNPGAPTPTSIDSGQFTGVSGLACPSESQCTAVDNMGREITFAPTDPGAPAPTPIDDTSLTGIACPSTTECVAVDNQGHVLEGNPQSSAPWSSQLVATTKLDAVACPSTTECVTVDNQGHMYATRARSASAGGLVLTPVRISAVAGRPVRQTVAYFVIPGSRRHPVRASDFRASVAWGDGRSSAAVVRPSGRVPAGFRGTRRVLMFEVDAAHTYATTAASRATVTVTGPGSGSVQVPVSVIARDPVARFYSNPVTATARKITLLIPAQPGPGQRAISSYVWNFGDGSQPVQDTPALRGVIMGAVRKLRSHPGSASLRYDAYFLGILPNPSSVQLTAAGVRQIAKLWLDYFPRHMVPHMYPSSGVFSVSLQITDSAGASSTESRDVGVEPECVSWSGWGPLNFVARGTCDTLSGFLAMTAAPNRPPDYEAYSISGLKALGAATVTLTVTRDRSVFVSLAGSLGVQYAALDFSIADGYVGPPGLPRGFPRPTNAQVDSFVDGWTIPVGGFALLRVGAGRALVYSPSVDNVGEEISVHFGGFGGGGFVQASCAVDLYHHVPAVGRLAPGNRVSFAYARSLISRVVHDVLAQAHQALADSATCVRGAAQPEGPFGAALFGVP
ncbi:MAG TPA: hypothetical protein VKV27_12180 [Solirubrobacteraceae bacterium]|nr:hypothetical protein [Solirubrobacteraceae bacterium]